MQSDVTNLDAVAAEVTNEIQRRLTQDEVHANNVEVNEAGRKSVEYTITLTHKSAYVGDSPERIDTPDEDVDTGAEQEDDDT
jgi:hypothetical protein